MLRRLWRWLFGTPDPSRVDVLLETLIESQGRVQQAMLQAVATISEASSKQSEVLGEYLKLFNQPGDPQGWRHPADDEVDEERNLADLARMGFPKEGTEAEQAKWVLDNIEKL
jgi:hypothetical protein